MNGLVNAIAPSLQVLKVEVQLIDGTVDILEYGAGGTGWPSATRHQRVQLGEVTLRDRLAPIVKALHSAQSVAQTFNIVSAKREIKRNANNNTGALEIPIGRALGDIRVFGYPL